MHIVAVSGSLRAASSNTVLLHAATEIVYKPVGLLNASSRSTHAQAQLAETLRTMSAEVVPGACVAVPLGGARPDVAAILANDALTTPLRGALEALAAAVHRHRENPEPWASAPS